MAIRTKSFHLESCLFGHFENIHTVETIPFPPLPYSSSGHAPVYFLGITLPAKCAQFTGWEDAFAATLK